MEQAVRVIENGPPIPAGDIDALFHAYGDMIYRLAFLRTKSGSDADDIVQEVFLRCLRAKPTWNSREHQKAWFLTVTINCTKSLLTSAFRRHTVPEKEDAVLTTMEQDTDVYGAVLKLPEKYRTAIHLFYYEGLKSGEIAGVLKRRPDAVRKQLSRARARMKRILSGEGFE